MKIQGVEGGDDAARAISASVWSLLPEGLRENVLAVSVPIVRPDVMKSDRCNFFFFPFNVNANSSSSFGLIFENMAVRDLRVYSEALFGKLYHYRDNTGLECDAVLHRRNGTYGLIEV